MAIEVDLAITNNCNLQCSHCCYSSGGKRYKDVPLEVIADTLAQLREMGGDELHLAGGEPFYSDCTTGFITSPVPFAERRNPVPE